MKHYRVNRIPAKNEMQYINTTCDMCGEVIGRNVNYNTDEVELSHRIGDNYPEGGCGTEKNIDMCGKCFEEKLVPWLESEGVKIVEEEWDW